MKPNDFYAPDTIEQLVEVLKLKRDRGDFYLVAGATDFMIDIRKKGIIGFTSIDLTHLDILKVIEQKNNCIEIGAAVTMARMEESQLIRDHANAIAEAAGRVGSTQIRNRGTIGGNIVNAAHCADLITPAFALGATVILLNSEGVFRELFLEEFILGSGRTRLEQDEALVKIRIPCGSKYVYSSFSKVGGRKSVTISKLNLAIRLVFKDNCVDEAAVYFGSIGPKAIRAVDMEKYCIGREWNKALKTELLEFGSAQIDKAIPTRSSRYYKRTAVKGVLSDVFDDIVNQREAR